MGILSAFDAIPPRAFPLRSLWWDMSPRETLRELPTLRAHLRALGISEVCVEVNAQADGRDGDLDFDWRADDLEVFADSLRRAGVRLSLMVWPYPNEWLRDVPHVCELAKKVGAWAIEYDVEGGNWKPGREDGGELRDTDGDGERDLGDAGRILIDSTRQHWDGAIGATFHTGRLNKTVSGLVDYIAPQLYARYKKDDDARAWTGPYGPGTQATHVRRLRRKFPKAQFIVCGLAAYSQTYPGQNPQTAMRVSYDSAVESGAAMVRWWSAKHVVRPENRDGGYAYEFLQSLA